MAFDDNDYKDELLKENEQASESSFYARRLLEEDRILFKHYDNLNRRVVPGMIKTINHESSYREECLSEDGEFNRPM